MDQNSLASMRVHYAAELFDIEHSAIDPFIQFGNWFNQAVEANIMEPNAMTLATCTKSGIPSARIVLLKDISNDGFVFYTNYESHKAKEIAENNSVALVFNWLELHRQVRIEGKATKLSVETSTQYFQTRPKGSQIGAWVSPQSSVIESREILEKKQAELLSKYKDQDVLPMPTFWGGYVVIPNRIEFWQGRPNRLHDRILYYKSDNGWKRSRLAP